MSAFLILLSFVVVGVKSEFQLQILHNNDVHSKFEETNADSGPCSIKDADQGHCFGGIARMKTAIDAALHEAELRKIPSLVLNSGDFFVGTPYYTLKKWEIVVPMVNALQFNATTIGNHDFDDGIENLVNYINNVEVPVVCCNLDLGTEPRLNLPKLKPSIVLNVDGVQVGIIGSLTPSTMEFAQTENLKILEEIPCVQAEAKRLKGDGVNIIILLSHSGFKEDIKIAKAIPELSLIVGGHSHTLLYTPHEGDLNKVHASEKYPYLVEQDSKKIPIVQAFAFGKYLGKLIVDFDNNGNVMTATGNPILLDSTIPEDEKIKHLVESWVAPLREVVKSPIAYTRVPLLPVDFSKGEFESTFANLVTDAIIDFMVRRTAAAGLKKWSTSSIVLMNTPGFRHELGSEGKISLEDVMDSLHSGNVLYEVTYLGSTIKNALEHSLIPKDGTSNEFPNYLHVSGLRVIYNLRKPINQRVESIQALCTDCITPQYEEFDLEKQYSIVLPRFLWKGNQGFQMLRTEGMNPVNLRGIQVRDVVQNYIERQKMLYPVWDGRVTVIKANSISQNHPVDVVEHVELPSEVEANSLSQNRLVEDVAEQMELPSRVDTNSLSQNCPVEDVIEQVKVPSGDEGNSLPQNCPVEDVVEHVELPSGVKA